MIRDEKYKDGLLRMNNISNVSSRIDNINSRWIG